MRNETSYSSHLVHHGGGRDFLIRNTFLFIMLLKSFLQRKISGISWKRVFGCKYISSVSVVTHPKKNGSQKSEKFPTEFVPTDEVCLGNWCMNSKNGVSFENDRFEWAFLLRRITATPLLSDPLSDLVPEPIRLRQDICFPKYKLFINVSVNQ